MPVAALFVSSAVGGADKSAPRGNEPGTCWSTSAVFAKCGMAGSEGLVGAPESNAEVVSCAHSWAGVVGSASIVGGRIGVDMIRGR